MNERERRRKRRQLRHTINIIAIIFVIAALLIAGYALTKQLKSPAATPTPKATPSPSAAATPTPAPPTPTPASANYTTITKSQGDIYNGKLILVNGSNSYRSTQPETMVGIYDNKVDGYKVSDTTDTVSADVVAPLNAMLSGFYSSTGNNAICILCGFRSLELQQKLFDREVAEKGEKEAAKWVAVPGTSEHHTGLALDFGIYTDSGEFSYFEGKGDYAWVTKNCHKYGFVLRYQTEKQEITKIYDETWHFRYVGVPHATEMTRRGLCLEEYIDLLRGYSAESPLTISTDDGGKYAAYYCKGLTVTVPKSGEYEVSGNNSDGFIVTVKL